MIRARNGDRKVILAGGYCSAGKPIYIYDIKLNQWSTHPNQMPFGVRYSAEFVFNNKLLVLGGFPSTNQVVEVTEASVTTVKPLSEPLKPHMFVKYPHSVPSK